MLYAKSINNQKELIMATFRLKGHEKFQLREGWITKGLYSVSKNPKIFTGNNGTDQLGVGNNMCKVKG